MTTLTITHGDETQVVNLCGSGGFPLRRIAVCPNCKQRRRFAGLDSGPYYGAVWTCCACGDSWSDGERLERPFQRGWRVKAIADARDVWARARSRAEHRAWLADLLGWS